MGDGGKVNGVAGAALIPVLGDSRVGSLDIAVRVGGFHGFEAPEGVVETLHGLGQTICGFGVALGAEFYLLLEKGYLHDDEGAEVSGGPGFLKDGERFGYAIFVPDAAFMFLPVGVKPFSALGNTLNGIKNSTY
jgi:hypothetical protein